MPISIAQYRNSLEKTATTQVIKKKKSINKIERKSCHIQNKIKNFSSYIHQVSLLSESSSNLLHHKATMQRNAVATSLQLLYFLNQVQPRDIDFSLYFNQPAPILRKNILEIKDTMLPSIYLNKKDRYRARRHDPIMVLNSSKTVTSTELVKNKSLPQNTLHELSAKKIKDFLKDMNKILNKNNIQPSDVSWKTVNTLLIRLKKLKSQERELNKIRLYQQSFRYSNKLAITQIKITKILYSCEMLLKKLSSHEIMVGISHLNHKMSLGNRAKKEFYILLRALQHGQLFDIRINNIFSAISPIKNENMLINALKNAIKKLTLTNGGMTRIYEFKIFYFSLKISKLKYTESLAKKIHTILLFFNNTIMLPNIISKNKKGLIIHADKLIDILYRLKNNHNAILALKNVKHIHMLLPPQNIKYNFLKYKAIAAQIFDGILSPRIDALPLWVERFEEIKNNDTSLKLLHIEALLHNIFSENIRNINSINLSKKSALRMILDVRNFTKIQMDNFLKPNHKVNNTFLHIYQFKTRQELNYDSTIYYQQFDNYKTQHNGKKEAEENLLPVIIQLGLSWSELISKPKEIYHYAMTMKNRNGGNIVLSPGRVTMISLPDSSGIMISNLLGENRVKRLNSIEMTTIGQLNKGDIHSSIANKHAWYHHNNDYIHELAAELIFDQGIDELITYKQKNNISIGRPFHFNNDNIGLPYASSQTILKNVLINTMESDNNKIATYLRESYYSSTGWEQIFDRFIPLHEIIRKSLTDSEYIIDLEQLALDILSIATIIIPSSKNIWTTLRNLSVSGIKGKALYQATLSAISAEAKNSLGAAWDLLNPSPIPSHLFNRPILNTRQHHEFKKHSVMNILTSEETTPIDINNLTKIAEGSIGHVYNYGNDHVLKVYSGNIDENHTARLTSANNNAKGFNRYYGPHSAIIGINKSNNGVSTVYTKLKKIRGDVLSSINQITDTNILTSMKNTIELGSPSEHLSERLKNSGIIHHDINKGNLIYDTKAGFLLIDFDSAVILSKGETVSPPLTETMKRKFASVFSDALRDINNQLSVLGFKK